jgi:hypothetical protein
VKIVWNNIVVGNSRYCKKLPECRSIHHKLTGTKTIVSSETVQMTLLPESSVYKTFFSTLKMEAIRR